MRNAQQPCCSKNKSDYAYYTLPLIISLQCVVECFQYKQAVFSYLKANLYCAVGTVFTYVNNAV